MISTGTGILGYNMYAYCNNNPVMYVNSSGLIPFEDHWYAEGLREFAFSIGCAIFDFFYAPTTKTQPVEEYEFDSVAISNSMDDAGVSVILDTTKLDGNPEYLKKYTDYLADNIEQDPSNNIAKGSINRAHLYSEIKLHVICWDRGAFVASTSQTDLFITKNGEVKDHRVGLNWLANLLYEKEYNS